MIGNPTSDAIRNTTLQSKKHIKTAGFALTPSAAKPALPWFLARCGFPLPSGFRKSLTQADAQNCVQIVAVVLRPFASLARR